MEKLIYQLYRDWVALMDDCRSGVSPKEFNNRQKDIANRYRRMNFVEQGEFHRLIAEDHMQWKTNL